MQETITLVGNIATEPERRTILDGMTVTSFRLATADRRYDKQSGRWTDGETSYYTVSAFRQLGEHAFASLRRGERIVVTGRLRIREWKNSTAKGVSAEVAAEALGHDLRWGVTQFRAGDRGASAAPADEPAPSVTAGGWALPGNAAPTSPDAAPSAEGETAAEPEWAPSGSPF